MFENPFIFGQFLGCAALLRVPLQHSSHQPQEVCFVVTLQRSLYLVKSGRLMSNNVVRDEFTIGGEALADVPAAG